MNENRKRLGRLTVEGTGQKLEFVSVLAGRFAGDVRMHIAKTEIGTYSIGVKGKTEDGEVIGHQMHLTRRSLSALVGSIFLFLEHEKENEDEFVNLAVDDESGYLYKTLDDLQEEGE